MLATRINISVNRCQLSNTFGSFSCIFGSFSGLVWERPHLYIAMNNIVVVAVPKCLQNLPHVVAGQTGSQNRQEGDHLGHPQIVDNFSF